MCQQIFAPDLHWLQIRSQCREDQQAMLILHSLQICPGYMSTADLGWIRSQHREDWQSTLILSTLRIHPRSTSNVYPLYINCGSVPDLHRLQIWGGSAVDVERIKNQCWSALHCWSAPRIDSVDCLYVDCWSTLHWLLIHPHNQQILSKSL